MRSVNRGHLMRFDRFKIPRTIKLRCIIFGKETQVPKRYSNPNTIDRMILLLSWHFQLTMLNVPSSESKLIMIIIIASKCEWVIAKNINESHGNDIVKKYTAHGSRMKTIHSDRMRRAEQMNYNRNIVLFCFV